MKLANKTFTLGSDPEFFLRDSQGALQSAIGLIPGDKYYPSKLADVGSILADNIMLEVNPLVSHSLEEFVKNHSSIMAEMEAVLSDYGISIDYLSSAVVAPDELLQHPDAMRFGCEPDFNAWKNGLTANPSATPETAGNLRSAGGHIHVGFEAGKDLSIRKQLIKNLDLVLGVPSVIIDSNGDLRKSLYGKAGAFRPKFVIDGSYDGAEYRTLSNFWMSSPRLVKWVYSSIQTLFDNFGDFSQLANKHKKDILSCINNNDKTLSHQLCQHLNLNMPS